MRLCLHYIVWLSISIFLLCSCSHLSSRKELHTEQPINIFPDYGTGIIIPSNIAPLNFSISEKYKKPHTQISGGSMTKEFRGHSITFSSKWWRNLLYEVLQSNDKSITIRITYTDNNGAKIRVPDIKWYVANDSIDPFLTYRLAQTIHCSRQSIQLRERDLTSFKESILIENQTMGGNCFNCHTSPERDPEFNFFHLRFPSEGSILQIGDHLEKVCLPSKRVLLENLPDSLSMPLNFVYTTWHPNRKYLAFCTNIIGISGYTPHQAFINIYDSASNIALYNIEKQEIILHKELWTRKFDESWPEWGNDGLYLYFCRAASPSVDSIKKYPDYIDRIQHQFFDFVRIQFDTTTDRFSDSIETILQGKPGCSYSNPRISPDGRWGLVCKSEFNSIPYQTQGDLVLVNLDSDSINGNRQNSNDNPADILNTSFPESWPFWSSNGHWVVFSSKRVDGLHTYPHIAYFDGEKFYKPFILPQKEPDFYQKCFLWFNLPSFSIGKSPLSPQKVKDAKESNSKILKIHPHF